MKKFAKVLVDRAGGTLGIVFEVQSAVGSRGLDVMVAGSRVDVAIRSNPDAGQIEGYLGYPLLAEIHPQDGCGRRAFVAAVASLIFALDSAGYDYVTTADFEDRLPNPGRNVPNSTSNGWRGRGLPGLRPADE